MPNYEFHAWSQIDRGKSVRFPWAELPSLENAPNRLKGEGTLVIINLRAPAQSTAYRDSEADFNKLN